MKRAVIFLSLSTLSVSFNAFAEEDVYVNEPLEVQGTRDELKTDYFSPSTFVTSEQMEQYNAVTVDDVIKYQPNLIVRRRFIGDPNATLGIRGSNMFQTTRSMVFADGLPLHYLLQSRFSGAPRWSLVAPDELDTAEVIYGPFNAEYSGNAIGGVVKMKTKLPQEEQIHAEGGFFYQPYSYLSTDLDLQGNRQFISYGNKFGDLSFYAFFNRLENEGQPQSYRGERSTSAPAGEPVVTGAAKARDERGRDTIFFADTGIANVETNLFKVKVGYDITSDLLAIFTLAYEDRDGDTTPNNYLSDAAGNPVWGDGNRTTNDASFNGEAFNVRSSRFGVSESNRETLLLGAHLEGKLTSAWNFDSTLSYFDILEDESVSSTLSPLDPNSTNAGRITEFDDTGWITYDLKFVNPSFLGNKNLSFSTGYHYENYELGILQYNSNNFLAESKDSPRQSSGGETTTHAVFAQLGWEFVPDWDVAVGLRYEDWASKDGFVNNGSVSTTANQPDRDESNVSPKFSLGYTPNNWTFRYSFAKAYRFPIVEELFKNVDAFNSRSIANPGLNPEDGIHHNFLIKYDMNNGFASVNIFRDDIDDVIFNQSLLVSGTQISSFLPIDNVVTNGVEFAMEQRRVAGSNFDVNFNLTWMDATVEEQRADPSIEGNKFPRLPKWRANIFSTYHVTDAWDVSLGARYQSDPYGRIDNTDNERDTFGAQDRFFMVDLKTTYRPSAFDGKISFGIDNLTDDEAFVFHPYPQRTFFLEAAVDF